MTLEQATKTKEGYSAIAYLDLQIHNAKGIALNTENPVKGYLDAMKLIRDTFDDLPAPSLYGQMKILLAEILTARVGIMMEELKELKSKELAEDTDEDFDPCKEMDCEKCDLVDECFGAESED